MIRIKKQTDVKKMYCSTGNIAWLVECLPSRCKNLSLISSTNKEKETYGKREEAIHLAPHRASSLALGEERSHFQSPGFAGAVDRRLKPFPRGSLERQLFAK